MTPPLISAVISTQKSAIPSTKRSGYAYTVNWRGRRAALGLPAMQFLSQRYFPRARTLFSAKESCQAADPAGDLCCNYSADNSAEQLGILGTGTRNDNLVVGTWSGDDGTNRALDVIHGLAQSVLIFFMRLKLNARLCSLHPGVWDCRGPDFDGRGSLSARRSNSRENLFRYKQWEPVFLRD